MCRRSLIDEIRDCRQLSPEEVPLRSEYIRKEHHVLTFVVTFSLFESLYLCKDLYDSQLGCPTLKIDPPEDRRGTQMKAPSERELCGKYAGGVLEKNRNEGLLMRVSVEWLIREYQTNLFVTAFNVCKNAEDAKDVVQDTFIAYYTSNIQFNDEQHIRAWLFRVTVNKAKDVRKSFWHRNKIPLEDYIASLPFETKEDSNLFETIMHLPEKYRIVIHLFYYEDWNIREISEILHISESNVKIRLSRGRALLKDVLKEEWADDE